MALTCLATHTSIWPALDIPGNPKPDVRVRVRGRVVQIEGEDASIRRIAPVAAPLKRASARDPITILNYT